MPDEPMEDALRLAEALVFSSAAPVTARQLAQILPDGIEAEAVIAALRARYAGRGVELAEVAGGFHFRTAPDLAARLRKVVQVPRKLPRAAMETLAIVAYHQPVTRAEIEEIRGAALAQATLDALLEAGLIAPKGRKEVPGRPTLWATTPAFLLQFVSARPARSAAAGGFAGRAAGGRGGARGRRRIGVCTGITRPPGRPAPVSLPGEILLAHRTPGAP